MGNQMDAKDVEKKERLLSALDGGMVMVHLDARRPGVLVPAHLRDEAHLRLNLSYRFDPPDLSVGDWGVRSTLTFSGTRFTVAIPWSALFAITSYTSREFWLYAEDMPRELVEQTLVTEKVPPAQAAPVPTKPKLVSVDLMPEPPDGTADAAATEDATPPKPRNHLRLVK